MHILFITIVLDTVDKVDSHIETRTYKKGRTPAGYKYSIHLKEVVDVQT